MKFDLNRIILQSSNKNKINEFKRILGDKLKVTEGKDLIEVNGSPDEVIIYKAIEAGKDVIVEDTILKVNGENIIDIKWKLKELINKKKNIDLVWETRLGILYDNNIYIFKGEVNGFLVEAKGDGFGFDPYFQPYGSLYTLAELDQLGKKDEFSARVLALNNFINGNYIKKINKDNIEKWKGQYQNEDISI